MWARLPLFRHLLSWLTNLLDPGPLAGKTPDSPRPVLWALPVGGGAPLLTLHQPLEAVMLP